MGLLPQKLKWCSELGLEDSRETNIRGSEWLANHIAIDGKGNMLNFPSLQEISKRAYAKMFRTAEYIAKKAADNGANHAVAFTITLPSRFHPSTTAGGTRAPNPRWDGSNPRDGKDFFDKKWAIFDNQCRRLGIFHEYIMATEPHEDETPHWHGVMWTNDPVKLKRLMIEYFYEKAEPEGGTAEVRVKVNPLKTAQEALAYASKTLSYIAKHQGGNNKSSEFAEEAERSQAWARAWGIRRLRKSGVGVTLYEYLRKLDIETAPDAEAKAIIEAAKKGDMYGALKPQRFKNNYVKATNIYGEEARRMDGVLDISTGAILYKTKYMIVGKKYNEQQTTTEEQQPEEEQQPTLYTPPAREKALRATAKDATHKDNFFNDGISSLNQVNYKYQTIIIDYFQPLSDEDYLIPAGFPEPDHPISNNINTDTS
jgi:hypothetical protein